MLPKPIFRVSGWRIPFVHILAVLVVLFPPRSLFSLEPVMLDPNILAGQLIGRHVEYCEDAGRGLSFPDIIRNGSSVRFRPVGSDILSFGYTSSAYWIRFAVYNPGPSAVHSYLEYAFYPVNTIEFYFPDRTGKYQRQMVGNHHRFGNRGLDFINYVFPLVEKPGKTRYYLRISSLGPITVPLKIWSLESLYKHANSSDAIMFVFFGIMGIMIIYNSVLSLSVRKMAYCYYVIFNFFLMIIFTINEGYGARYLWPDTPKLNDLTLVFLPLTIFFGIQFARSYLSTASGLPAFDRMVLRPLLLVSFITGIIFFPVYSCLERVNAGYASLFVLGSLVHEPIGIGALLVLGIILIVSK